jgi:hypothetical protein
VSATGSSTTAARSALRRAPSPGAQIHIC